MARTLDDKAIAAIELARIGFYRYLFDGTIVDIDQVTFEFMELEGLFESPQCLIGTDIATLLEYTGPKGRLRSEIRSKGRVAGLEYGFRTLKGSERWGYHNSYLFVDEKTGQEAVQVCFLDITERKTAERALATALQNSERQRREIEALLGAAKTVLTAPDVWSTAQTLLIHAERALEAGAGVIAFASKDVNDLQVVLEDYGDGPRRVQSIQAMELEGLHTAVYGSAEAIAKNDSSAVRWVCAVLTAHVHLDSLLLVPITNGGDVVGLIGLANRQGGFSENHRGVGIGFGQLASVVYQRDEAYRRERELAGQLQQSSKLESIGLLAGGVAHDFNNILMAIMGCASLALDAAVPDSSQAGDLKSILDSCRRARDLTSNLLGFARKGKYEPRVVSCENLLADVKLLLDRTVPKTVDIRVNIKHPLASVKLDRSQMQTVLLNICNNAVDAMAHGLGVLAIVASTVEFHEGDAANQLVAGRYVLIEIRDSGVGMDRETLSRAREPFFTTKPKGRGTGLGLSMAHGTITNHGGAMKIESLPGAGTTVRLYLPACQDTVLAPHGGDRRFAEDRRLVGETVLLVDDEPVILSIGRRMLESMGYEVLLAADGLEALDVYGARRDDVALVVLDLNMPRLDGVETFKALRDICSTVPILIATGYDESSRAAELLEAGATALLRKPFEPRLLADAIDRLIRCRQSAE